MAREEMNYDLLIVGAGPAGLASAIRFKQLARDHHIDLSVAVIEKGSEVGAHILSGAVFEPHALTELLPDWKKLGAPLNTEAKEDHFLFLTENKSFKLPTPPQMHNKGNYIISLGNLCRWLGVQAESMGIEIYPGFTGSKMLYNDEGQVIGVGTGDMGIDKEGQKTAQFTDGVNLLARHTLLAEGCRGSLSEEIIAKFDLRKDRDPQTYGIGFKELWEIDPAKHSPGKVVHSIGWPLDRHTYGGSFLYHLENNQVALGFVIGLDYQNPHLSPFDEFQRYKTHPSIRHYLEGGRRISYGARALNEGGYQSIPKLSFLGGALVGCAAGFMNVPKIKGSNTAMKSGMIAAEAAFAQMNPTCATPFDYEEAIKSSWVGQELKKVRNIRPSFQKGLYFGILYSALDTYILRGKAPWTFNHHEDHKTLKKAEDCSKIEYPKPDGKISFDKLSSVFISNTNHAENQPCHLKLKNKNTPIDVNLKLYDAPEQRYCPAGVYEIVQEEGLPHLHINAQNCIHCKTCDIKDPMQNIQWVTPEGGGGPNYPNM
ncbi:MAG: electron transfer flavoprotein-ubiquinone oxidoreductase [Alphaproteobacteria bacterium]|nr:electron transfer flavoprotein-ubiquinone oxidoreductase [Alphaproteobacteria bacterium]